MDISKVALNAGALNGIIMDTLCLMVSSLVMGKLFYCSSVWSNTTSKNVKKLQAVQNFACRIVSNTRKFDHITPAMEELE